MATARDLLQRASFWQPPPCRNGAECWRPACVFSHPSSPERRLVVQQLAAFWASQLPAALCAPCEGELELPSDGFSDLKGEIFPGVQLIDGGFVSAPCLEIDEKEQRSDSELIYHWELKQGDSEKAFSNDSLEALGIYDDGVVSDEEASTATTHSPMQGSSQAPMAAASVVQPPCFVFGTKEWEDDNDSSAPTDVEEIRLGPQCCTSIDGSKAELHAAWARAQCPCGAGALAPLLTGVEQRPCWCCGHSTRGAPVGHCRECTHAFCGSCIVLHADRLHLVGDDSDEGDDGSDFGNDEDVEGGDFGESSDDSLGWG